MAAVKQGITALADALRTLQKSTNKSQIDRATDFGGPDDFYHGSTHNIQEMDGSKANPANDWGRGTYATNTPADANANYAGIGPDLRMRISKESEDLSEGFYNDDYELDELLTQRNLTRADYDNDPTILTEPMAKENLVGEAAEGVVYPLKIDQTNYARIGDTQNPSYIEADNDRALYNKLKDAFKDTDAWDRDADIENMLDYLWDDADIFGGTVDATDLTEAIRRDMLDIVDESTGELVSGGEIASQVLSNLDFDGIVDSTVDVKFGTGRNFGQAMEGVNADTRHVITFPDKEHTIRAKNALFDPENKGKKKMMGGATPAALAATAAGTTAGTAAALRQQPEENKFLGIPTRDISSGFDRAMEALDVPAKGLNALAHLATALRDDTTFDQALNKAATVAKQPLEKTAQGYGEKVLDETGSPLAATAAHVAGLMAAPI